MAGLTAAQIVSLACQSAHAQGFKVQAGQLLNMILSDLAQTQDLDLCRGKFSFNFVADNGSGNGSGPYSLPLDYYRHTRDGVFFTVDGVPYILVPYDQSEFDLLVTTPGLENYPTVFYTDISPLNAVPASNPLMYVWQPANGVYPVTVRYYKYLPDITTPETSTTIPWFPNQDYLITKLTAHLAVLADDSRAPELMQAADVQLRKFMQMTNDDEGKAKTVSLDRRRFGNQWSRLSNTKKIGFF